MANPSLGLTPQTPYVRLWVATVVVGNVNSASLLHNRFKCGHVIAVYHYFQQLFHSGCMGQLVISSQAT